MPGWTGTSGCSDWLIPMRSTPRPLRPTSEVYGTEGRCYSRMVASAVGDSGARCSRPGVNFRPGGLGERATVPGTGASLVNAAAVFSGGGMPYYTIAWGVDGGRCYAWKG